MAVRGRAIRPAMRAVGISVFVATCTRDMDYSKGTLEARTWTEGCDAVTTVLPVARTTDVVGDEADRTTLTTTRAAAPSSSIRSRRCSCQHCSCTCDGDPRRVSRLGLVGHPDVQFADTLMLEQRLVAYRVAFCSHLRLAVSVESRVFTQSVLLIRYANGMGEELFNLDDLSRLLCRCHGQRCFAQSMLSFRKLVSRLVKPRYRTSWSVLRNYVGRFGDAFWERSAKYVDHYGFLFVVMMSMRPECETIRQYVLEGVRRSGLFLNVAQQPLACSPSSSASLLSSLSSSSSLLSDRQAVELAWLRQRCAQLEQRCRLYECTIASHAADGGTGCGRCRESDQQAS